MADAALKHSSNQKIFSDVKYFVTGTLPEQVKKILEDENAEKINFFSDMVTHCIVGDQPRENDISDAKDLYEVPAVTPYWVLLSAFCNKILPTRGFAYDPHQIFSNTVVTASQISNADFKAIWAMITFYGGKFKSNLDKTCTHLVCGKPNGKKYETALCNENIRIITPDWVVESIKAGSKVDETSFHPRYLIFPKPRENTPPAPGDLSTAQILGFADDVTSTTTTAPAPLTAEGPSSLSSTQALLEKLKQRMPWNRPPTAPPVSAALQMPFSQPSYPGMPQPKIISQQQIQTTQSQIPTLAVPTNTAPVQQQTGQPQQMERMTIDTQSRVIQQGPVWRPAPGQNVRPQYTLIQRDGSVVQAQATNWSQFHLQQQRLQQQAPGQPTQQQQQTHIQQQQISNPQQPQPPQLQQQTQQLQQASAVQSSQIQGTPAAPTAGIQVQGGQTQRQITWTQQPQLQGPPKQVIQLDAQTHAQLSQMDPHQRTLFLQKIQRQRQIILQQRQIQLQQQQQQQQQQQRQVGQPGQINPQQQPQQALPPQQPQQQQQQQQQQPPQQSQPQPQQPQQQQPAQPQSGPQQQQQQQQPLAIPMRQPQIIIRGVMPPGLNPQQQAVWLHQQQFIRQQQILVQQQGGQIRQAVGGTQQRIVQQQTATSTWIPQQAENQQQQLQLQRQQQMRIQQLQIQKQQQIVVQRTAASVPQQFQQAANQQPMGAPPVTQAIHPEDTVMHAQAPGAVGVGGGLLVNNRTKTALANMLSSRLQTGHLSPQAQVIGQSDGSAAGQLRLMSAQQRTPQPPPPPPPPPPQNQLPESQQAIYAQQRRTLGNITNSGSGARPTLPAREVPPAGAAIPVPKSPARTAISTPAPSPAGAVPQKPQFFAHNPSLRIPPDKYFLGCVFFFVEYDRSPENDLVAWEEIIRDHGGEVECSYTHRVTHVLCETQKHGIVQQALRDGKRCITAFWLNDVVLRGSLSVPWLALHFPVPFGREKPLSKYHMTLTGFDDRSERERVATMIQVAGGQYRNYLSPLTHIVVCKKAEGAKYKKAKETNKVTVNVQWLNEVLFGHYTCIQQPDFHKYQQYNLSTSFRVDYSLIPHLMGAWKLPINVTSEVYNAVKNSPPPLRRNKKPRIEPTLEQIRDLENKILEPVQIINLENFTSENRPHVLVTGDKNLEVTKKGKEIGCVLSRNSNRVTHLVVCGKPQRTLKMLKGLILAKYVVRDSWLIDSSAQNKLLSESPYLIHQVDTDEFKCNVAKIIASPDRNVLFKDKIFYLTPNVEPSRNALTELIILSGGQVEKQRRSVKAIQELNKTIPTYIVVSCYNDLALIADVFRAKLEFYSAEFILKAITNQSIDYMSSVYRY